MLALFVLIPACLLREYYHCQCLLAQYTAGRTPVSYLGALNYKYTGWSTSTGDVDGDGINDLLVGGGRVYLILGKNIGLKKVARPSKILQTLHFLAKSVSIFGDAVCAAGDVNNDGFDDILIGAPRTFRNKAYLVLGKADGWSMNLNIVDMADATFVGESTSDYFGYSLAFAGDINNDNFDDS